jgi:DNA-directed RNA polymerase subunit omega
MVNKRMTLMDPPIEELFDKVDSKFTLVTLGAKRAREINAYYQGLGEMLGRVIPPQVTSVSGKPLSISFEEIAQSKVGYHRPTEEELEAEAAALADAQAGGFLGDPFGSAEESITAEIREFMAPSGETVDVIDVVEVIEEDGVIEVIEVIDTLVDGELVAEEVIVETIEEDGTITITDTVDVVVGDVVLEETIVAVVDAAEEN